VHVWTENGEYVGQIFGEPGWKLKIDVEDEGQRDKIRTALKQLVGGADIL
jgi:hypothetical protein